MQPFSPNRSLNLRSNYLWTCLVFISACIFSPEKDRNPKEDLSLGVQSMNEHDIDTKFMKEVIELARAEVEKNGLPFATIIVNSENKVVGRAVNQVKHSFDITDHAELIAVRQVTTAAKITDLKGHKVYIIGHPCSMCLSALMMAKPDKIYFAASLAEKDAVLKSKDRIDLYAEIVKPFDQRVVPMEQMTILRDSALAVYKAWEQKRSVR